MCCMSMQFHSKSKLKSKKKIGKITGKNSYSIAIYTTQSNGRELQQQQPKKHSQSVKCVTNETYYFPLK